MQQLQHYQAKLAKFSVDRNETGGLNLKIGNEVQRSMQIRARTIFSSDFFTINDLICQCPQALTKSETDCNSNFNITFTREGYFTFNSFKASVDAHIGNIFLKKPGCEYSVTQMTDRFFECTIINFSANFLQALEEKYELKKIDFFRNPDLFTLALRSQPEFALLHFLICEHLSQLELSKLYIDCLVVELVESLVERMAQGNAVIEIAASNIKYQIRSIERAKEYMARHLGGSICLHELSRHCYASPFHFSRVFKKLTGYSPYHYLQMLRLKHAEILLKTTTLSIADIGFKSGFNTPDYFCAAFSRSYKMSPSGYRRIIS